MGTPDHKPHSPKATTWIWRCLTTCVEAAAPSAWEHAASQWWLAAKRSFGVGGFVYRNIMGKCWYVCSLVEYGLDGLILGHTNRPHNEASQVTSIYHTPQCSKRTFGRCRGRSASGDFVNSSLIHYLRLLAPSFDAEIRKGSESATIRAISFVDFRCRTSSCDSQAWQKQAPPAKSQLLWLFWILSASQSSGAVVTWCFLLSHSWSLSCKSLPLIKSRQSQTRVDEIVWLISEKQKMSKCYRGFLLRFPCHNPN